MQDSKTYLDVPYAQKDEAKALGARWDPAKKQWYAPANIDMTVLAKWQAQPGSKKPSTTKRKTKSSTSGKKVVSGITTYGKNKDLTSCNDNSPPWD